MSVELAALRLCQPVAQLLGRAPEVWRPWVQAWQHSPDGQALINFVDQRVAAGAPLYPPQILQALEFTPLDQVKVVILGQDPYHGPGQAHGLAFSVRGDVRVPPSLRNILAELKRDLGIARQSGDLSTWATQGVLLINTTLTVEQGLPGSHGGRGWESLTQNLLRAVAQRASPCVYMLWGAHAQQFAALIASEGGVQALILKANHPSPLSARRAPAPFLGCGHFGLADRYLARCGLPGIDWAS